MRLWVILAGVLGGLALCAGVSARTWEIATTVTAARYERAAAIERQRQDEALGDALEQAQQASVDLERTETAAQVETALLRAQLATQANATCAPSAEDADRINAAAR